MVTNSDCTIYRKNADSEYEYMHIYKVFWDDVQVFNSNKHGKQSSNKLAVYIPFSSASFDILKEDIIVKGIVSDDIKAKSDLAKKYKEVYTITAVDKKDFGSMSMRHWQIAGD